MSASPGRSLGDRVADARRRSFAGRSAEVELFVQNLEADEPSFAVLFVHGPGGVGKSTLLARFADEARARGVLCTTVDGRSTAPLPGSFLGAIGAPTVAEVGAKVCGGSRGVLLVDTYEELLPLDDWLRDDVLPLLPSGALVVLAGRQGPRPAWRTDAGLASIVRVRALRNLRAEESAQLLAARGVDEPVFAGAHALTHGHPLALVLVAELVRDAGAGALPALTPDVVRVLLERIVRTLPDASHLAALEVASLVRVTTEDLLRDLGVEPSADLFAWMCGLSFMRRMDEGGVAPHDLVRDALAADLGFRDPTRHAELTGKIAARSRRMVERASGRARERAFFDMLFSLRSDPRMAPFYDWDRGHSGGARPLRASELEKALVDVERHEGPTAVRIARHWWSRQPEAFIALLDASGAYVGMMVYLRVGAIDAADAERDPAAAAAAAIVRDAPLRPGEHTALLRFWVWADRYQDLGSAAHSAHSMVVALDWMFSSTLAWCALVVQRVEAWRAFFAVIGFTEHQGASFSLDGRDFYLFGRDFRARPWGGPSSNEGTMPGPTPAPRPPPRIVLSRPDFEAAVRDALRLASRPAELAGSPLLASRLLADWAEDEQPAAQMIPELLAVAASGLKDDRDDRPRKCVELAYLRPAPTHEIAAERLGLSFSTFRRQLARGVERIVEWLWDREVHGARR